MKLQCGELLSSFAFKFNLRRYNLEQSIRTPPADTKKVLLDECDGEKECIVKPSALLFGTPPKVSATEPMSLMVIARCVSISAAARERANRAAGKIDVPCAEGCYSCDQVAAEVGRCRLIRRSTP